MSVRKNTLINLVGYVIPMAVMLVTIPLYLKLLGDDRYGVLALVWLILGYFSFMEMGLGKATANQIAKAKNATAHECAEIFGTAIILNACMGLVAAFILWMVGDYLITNVLKMPENFRDEAISALPWLVATLPLALISSVLNGALEGANKFFLLNILQVIGSAVFQIVPLLVAYWVGPSLEYIIPAAVIAKIVINLPLIYACHLFVTDKKSWVLSYSRAKSLLSYGSWIGLSSIVTPVLETIDRFVIGAIVGAKAVTYYTIAFQLAAKLRIIPGALSRALLPRLSISSDDRYRVAVHAMHVITVMMTIVSVMVALILNPFLEVWVGPSVAEKVNTLGYLFLFGIWINSIGHVPVSLLLGLGKSNVVGKTHLFETLPYVALLYICTVQFGVVGAVFAWVIRVTIDTVIMCVLPTTFDFPNPNSRDTGTWPILFIHIPNKNK
jgi:O-antigen/teichoic acid export membrane protein